MSVLNIQSGSLISLELTRLSQQLLDHRQQLSTGKKYSSHSDYKLGAHLLIGARQQKIESQSYIDSIDQTLPQINVLYQHIERLSAITSNLRDEAIIVGNGAVETNRVALVTRAELSTKEIISIFNSKFSNNFLFGGRKFIEDPVVDFDTLLYGDQKSRAGLKQIVEERLKADLGADNYGRLTLVADGNDKVLISKDGVHDFGFTPISLILPDGSEITPSGSPVSLSIDFANLDLVAGDEIKLQLQLPDDSIETLSFTLSGRSVTDIRDNFQSSLQVGISDLSKSSLHAVSVFISGTNFFSTTSAPQRIVGSDFYSSTSKTAGSASDTVFWYQGESAGEIGKNRRLLSVDENFQIGYAVSADEAPLRDSLKSAAILLVDSMLVGGKATPERQTKLALLVGESLSSINEVDDLSGILSSLASNIASIDNARERHVSSIKFTNNLISDIENVDINEVAVKLLHLQNQLEASYSITSRLASLSLLNYL